MSTVDPDLWYRSGPDDSKKDLLQQLEECKRAGNVEFVGVLFLAANFANLDEKSIGDKFLAMKANLFTAELEKARKKRDQALEDLQKHTEYKRTRENRLKRVAVADAEIQELTKKQKRAQSNSAAADFDLKTSYYLKILAAASVEEIFGSVFNRLLHATKGNPA